MKSKLRKAYGKISDFCLVINNIKNVKQMVTKEKISKSYCTEFEQKSRSQIYKENLFWLIRNKEINKYYYLYGFDKKEKNNEFDYMPYREFKKLRNRNNMKNFEANNNNIYNYLCILKDKYIFSQFLKSLSIPIPNSLALANKEHILMLNTLCYFPISEMINHLPSDEELFCKDFIGEDGKGIFQIKIIDRKIYMNGKEIDIETFKNNIKGSVIIQEEIQQNKKLSYLYPNSVNTIRMITINNNGNIEVFGAFLRIGSKENKIDNWVQGGILVPIDINRGALEKHGLYYLGFGGKTEINPNNNEPFYNYEIPFFKEAVEMSKLIHSSLYGIHSIGWDIAITENGPLFIEGNDNWGIDSLQSYMGGLKEKFISLCK